MADWSSVFEETGEEDGDWDRYDVDSGESRTDILQYLQDYNPLVAYFFTVNYVLGVGCLGIPYAFQQSGLLLASFLVIFVSFISYITVLYVAEASHRGMVMKTERRSKNPFLSPIPSHKMKSLHYKPILANIVSTKYWSFLSDYSPLSKAETVPLNSAPSTISSSFNSLSQDQPVSLPSDSNTYSTSFSLSAPRNRPRFDSIDSCGEADKEEESVEMEVTELASEFLGPWGKVCYQSALVTLTFVGLLAYAQVFNNSFKEQFWPSCSDYFPVLLFGIIVVPLSCIDLAEQITVQVAMSMLRFVSLGVLLFGTLAAIYYGPAFEDLIAASIAHPHHSHHPIAAPVVAPTIGVGGEEEGVIPLFKIAGFSVMFTTAIFSQLFQHSVPGLIRPLAKEHKQYVPYVFGAALCTTATLYIAIGCCCAYYFGMHTNPSINLNFVGFAWGVSSDSKWSSAANMAALLIVIFPTLDTLSVFPLIANTLGNNLYAAVPKTKKYLRKWKFFGTEKAQVKRSAVVLWRLVAAIPPLVGSLFVNNLSMSLQLAGICGIFVALVTPALLQMAGDKLVISASGGGSGGGNTPRMTSYVSKLSTPYSASFSQSRVSTAVLVIAGVAFSICVFQMIGA